MLLQLGGICNKDLLELVIICNWDWAGGQLDITHLPGTGQQLDIIQLDITIRQARVSKFDMI